jgi:dolichol kinase
MMVMVVPFLSILSVFVLLVLSEVLWRAGVVRGETARKLLHIIIGTFVAFWPFLMGLRTVQFISVAFLIVIIISRRFHIFHAIHNARREAWGEIFFAISIGLIPFITSSRLVFAAAVLHMSLADGLAGLIGTRFGNRTRFTIFRQTKSLVGSLTFAAVSYTIVLGFFKASPVAVISDINWMIIILPILATLLETASIKGTDNLLVPVMVALALNSVLI